MQFYNVICCFLWYLLYFYFIYEFIFNVLEFLIITPPQKLVLAREATIRNNMVCVKTACNSLLHMVILGTSFNKKLPLPVKWSFDVYFSFDRSMALLVRFVHKVCLK